MYIGCGEVLAGVEWVQTEGPCLYLETWILNCMQKEPAKDVKMESIS